MPPLKERKLVQWGAAYLAGAWLLLQVAALLAAPFGWPDAVLRAATVFLALGFLPALVLAWYHGEKGAQRATAVEVLVVVGLVLGAGAAALVSGSSVTTGGPPSDEAVADRNALAVLPFVNMSPDPEDEYFSDGITEELLNALAQVEGLRVASRTSSFAFRRRDVRLDSIARELRVAYVLQGSVRRDGDRLRIGTQLIDARTDAHVWSQRYDRQFQDIFAIQEEIARSIVDRMRVELGVPDAPALVHRGTENVEAYDLYLRGRHLTSSSSVSNEKAIEHLRRAIELDRGYALAHAGLADAYIARAEYTAPRATLPHARAAALMALDLDSTLVETRLALAAVRQVYDRDWAAAEREIRRALALDPTSVAAWAQYAEFLFDSRRFEDATRAHAREWELRAAEVGDTLDPRFRVRRSLARSWVAARTGRIDMAVAYARAAVELDPESARARWVLGLMYLAADRPDDAVRELEPVSTAAGGRLPLLSHLGFAYARAGRRQDALAILDTLHARATAAYVPKDQFALLHLALGDTARALQWLEGAVDDYHWWMPNTNVHAFWDPLRSHPRFVALMRRLGAPPVPG